MEGIEPSLHGSREPAHPIEEQTFSQTNSPQPCVLPLYYNRHEFHNRHKTAIKTTNLEDF